MADTLDQVKRVTEKIRQVTLLEPPTQQIYHPNQHTSDEDSNSVEADSPPPKLESPDVHWQRSLSHSERKRQRAPRFRRRGLPSRKSAPSPTRRAPKRSASEKPNVPSLISWERPSDVRIFRRSFGASASSATVARPPSYDSRSYWSYSYSSRDRYEEEEDEEDEKRMGKCYMDRMERKDWYHHEEDTEDGPWRSNWRSAASKPPRSSRRSTQSSRGREPKVAASYSQAVSVVAPQASARPSDWATPRNPPAMPPVFQAPSPMGASAADFHANTPIHFGTHPLLYVDTSGIISVMLRHNVVIEMTVDKTIRLLVSGVFSAASNQLATKACIMHPKGRIYQEGAYVYSHFGSDKLAVIGPSGVVFTMKSINLAYLVSANRRQESGGPIRYESSGLRFPSLSTDFTLSLIHQAVEAQKSSGFAVAMCNEIVQAAKYTQSGDELVVNINGVSIKQDGKGDVQIHAPPRHIQASPLHKSVQLRSNYVDMAVLDENRAHVKRGVKRVHVSHSGMVVSDGFMSTALDFDGNIVSDH